MQAEATKAATVNTVNTVNTTTTMSPVKTITSTSTWRASARCRGADPEVFHPEEDDVVAEDGARAVCALCPVREPCLQYALDARERDGVWGGLSARERRRILRHRRKAA